MKEALGSVREISRYYTTTVLVLCLLILTAINPSENVQMYNYLINLKNNSDKIIQQKQNCYEENKLFGSLASDGSFAIAPEDSIEGLKSYFGLLSNNLKQPKIDSNCTINDLQTFSHYYKCPKVWLISSHSIQSQLRLATQSQNLNNINVSFELDTVRYMSDNRQNFLNGSCEVLPVYGNFMINAEEKINNESRRHIIKLAITAENYRNHYADSCLSEGTKKIIYMISSSINGISTSSVLKRLDKDKPINELLNNAVLELKEQSKTKITFLGYEMDFNNISYLSPLVILLLLLFLLVQVLNVRYCVDYIILNKVQNTDEYLIECVLFPSIMFNKENFNQIARVFFIYFVPCLYLFLLLFKNNEINNFELLLIFYYVFMTCAYLLTGYYIDRNSKYVINAVFKK